MGSRGRAAPPASPASSAPSICPTSSPTPAAPRSCGRDRRCRSRHLRLRAAAATFRTAGIDPAKLAVIRNGLPARAAGRPARCPAVFGLDERCPSSLTTARFTPQKDHATLLDALPAVLARHPACRIWLAGTGPLEDEAQATGAALGVAGAVSFMGTGPTCRTCSRPPTSSSCRRASRACRWPCWRLWRRAAGGGDRGRRHRRSRDRRRHGPAGPPGDPDALASAIWRASRDPARHARSGRGPGAFRDAFTAPAWRTRRRGSSALAFRPGHNEDVT